MQHKHNLHEALLRLRDLGPYDPVNGICSNLEYFLDGIFEEKDISDNAYSEVRNLMMDVACDWPKYSGCDAYPIPNPDLDPAEFEPGNYHEVAFAAYAAYTYLNDEAWDRTKPYGALRYELLDFLIERTKP